LIDDCDSSRVGAATPLEIDESVGREQLLADQLKLSPAELVEAVVGTALRPLSLAGQLHRKRFHDHFDDDHQQDDDVDARDQLDLP
jgi:hypothetical protein